MDKFRASGNNKYGIAILTFGGGTRYALLLDGFLGWDSDGDYDYGTLCGFGKITRGDGRLVRPVLSNQTGKISRVKKKEYEYRETTFVMA